MSIYKDSYLTTATSQCVARQLSVGSPGVEYHVNDRPYYWVKEYSGNFGVSENIPGTEHGWCRTDPMSLKCYF